MKRLTLFFTLLLGSYVELVLASRAYVFQSFSVSEVLGASKMNQIEANIRDHQHGVASVSNVVAATQAQMEAATDNTLATVTALAFKWHPGAIKAVMKATVSGGTPTLQTPPSYNITSITDTDTARLTVTIATDFSSAQWCCIPGVEMTGTVNGKAGAYVDNGSQAAGSVILEAWEAAGSPAEVGYVDPVAWHMIGMGDQ